MGIRRAGSARTRQYALVSFFADACLTAFSELVASHAMSLDGAVDEEWYAKVEWRRREVSLTVTDDRRDRVTDVFFATARSALGRHRGTGRLGTRLRRGRRRQKTGTTAATR